MFIAGVNQTELTRISGLNRFTVCRILNSRQDCLMSTFIRLLESCGVQFALTVKGANIVLTLSDGTSQNGACLCRGTEETSNNQRQSQTKNGKPAKKPTTTPSLRKSA